jgi:hypothetical protein
LGATFALAAVIGVRYLIEWARTQPLFGVNPVVPEAEPPAHRSAIPAGGPTIERELAPPAPVAPAVPSAPASPAAPPPTVPNSAPSASPSASPSPSPASGAGGAAAAEAVPAAPVTHPPAPTAAAPDAGAPAVAVGDSAKGKGESAPAPNAGGEPAEQEPDEEALLRNAVPDAESAVIGEEEAEETAKAGTGTPGAPSRPVAKPKGAPKAAAHATASATPHVETVSVHITSTPVGAVVRTKHKVLGRTPINLHFRGDNIYELMFIKQGYAQATKRLTISGPSSRDRKLSVALKKNPTGVRRTGLFHMHR